jgi:predicted PurR-regulated permease PerM
MLMAFVPVVGTVPVSAGASLYLFFNGHIGWGIVMSVGAILATISDNIVRPWVLKGASQLHPMLALISAFGAIQLLGPTGIFLGPVIAAVFVAFLKIAFTN